jgi:hypothetical protein
LQALWDKERILITFVRNIKKVLFSPVSKQNKTKQNKNPEKTPVTGGAKTPDWELSESDGWKNST